MAQAQLKVIRRIPWWQGRRFQDVGSRTLVFLLLAFGAISYLIPLAWMLSTALMSEQQVTLLDSGWIPKPFVWQNFVFAIETFPFLLYLRNSLITSVLPTFLAVVSSLLVGYAFARVQWPGRDFVFILVLSTMMLPGQVTMIPVYVIWARLKMIGTFVPLVLPSIFGGAWNIFLVRQFLRGIPQDLSDAATIDGCSHMGIIWRIMLPLSKPVLATIAVLNFMGHWNDLFGPVIYLRNSKLYTLMVGLTYFTTEYRVNFPHMMAASFVVLVPSILIFFIGQKYFVQGIVMTGIKG